MKQRNAKPILARHIRLLRRFVKHMGSQQAAADKLDINQSTMSRWLRGDRSPVREIWSRCVSVMAQEGIHH